MLDKKSEVYKVLKTYGTQVINEMKTRLVNLGKVASGGLLKSLKFTVEDNGDDQLELFIIAADYAEYVDKGRKPGKMPPVDAIKKWCKLKGIPEEAAWPIAVNIGKFGIPPTNFYTLSVTRRVKQLEKQLEVAAAKDIENAVAKELEL